MREIHLLENNEACTNFVLARTSQEFSPESFLGVGTFSSYVPSIGKGLMIRSSPVFFENELSDNIVQGHFSVFEREPLLMQVPLGEVGNLPISRWFLFGQHLSIFQSSKIDVKKYLPSKDLLNVKNVEEFMQVYLDSLFPHIQEIRAQSILFLFDITILSNYVFSFFNWLSEHNTQLKELVVSLQNFDIQKKITEEFLWYLSDSALHPCIAIYPSTQTCFNIFIHSVRNIRKKRMLSNDIFFRL